MRFFFFLALVVHNLYKDSFERWRCASEGSWRWLHTLMDKGGWRGIAVRHADLKREDKWKSLAFQLLHRLLFKVVRKRRFKGETGAPLPPPQPPPPSKVQCLPVRRAAWTQNVLELFSLSTIKISLPTQYHLPTSRWCKHQSVNSTKYITFRQRCVLSIESQEESTGGGGEMWHACEEHLLKCQKMGSADERGKEGGRE